MLRAVTISFVLLCTSLCAGSGPGPASQKCGTTNFYCPVDQMCKPRDQRCTGSNICLNNAGVEDKCECRADGKCAVYKGTSPLSSSSSSKRDLQLACLKYFYTSTDHNFIDFKGFTYEFGSSYGKQVLDRNEPPSPYGYKYTSSNTKSYTRVGYSDCTYEEAMVFVNDFYSRYCLCTHNCQDFARGLQRWLVTDNCNRVRSSIGRRQTNSETEDLSQYFAEISFHDCNETTTESGGSALIPSFVLSFLVIFATIILLAHM